MLFEQKFYKINVQNYLKILFSICSISRRRRQKRMTPKVTKIEPTLIRFIRFHACMKIRSSNSLDSCNSCSKVINRSCLNSFFSAVPSRHPTTCSSTIRIFPSCWLLRTSQDTAQSICGSIDRHSSCFIISYSAILASTFTSEYANLFQFSNIILNGSFCHRFFFRHFFRHSLPSA